MPESDSPDLERIRRLSTLAGGVLAALLVAGVPLGYLFMSGHHARLEAATTAEILAPLISQVVSADPDRWEYQELRLSEFLERRRGGGHPEIRRVRNLRGRIVAAREEALYPPLVTSEVPVRDAGEIVGSLEVSRSLAPALLRTALFALLLLPAGILTYAAIRVLPVREVTRLLAKLQHSEGKYTRLFEFSRDAVLLHDEQGRIQEANRKALTLFECGPGEIAGLSLADLFPEQERDRIERYLSLAAEGEQSMGEVSMCRGDGSCFSAAVSSAPLPIAGERVIQTLVRDLTRERQTEEMLRQAQKLEAVGLLAGGVAHEFNNAMQSIMGYASLIEHKLPGESPLRPYVETILTSLDRAAQITQKLLAFSRQERMQLQRVDLREIVAVQLRYLSRQLGEAFTVRPSLPERPLWVMADPAGVHQVLLNLLQNGRDAMPSGGALEVSLTRATPDARLAHGGAPRYAGEYACLAISDSGPGIPVEIRERVFDPFFTTKEPGKATGLGLSIVYGVVRQHRGIVTLSSGDGTTFRVYLPLAPEEAAAAVPAPLTPPPGWSARTVLLAEDDEAFRDAMRAQLEALGCTVVAAVNGEEAVRRFAESGGEIPVVLMDVRMPLRSGQEALAEIRRIRPEVRAILMSGISEEAAEELRHQTGALGVLTKPVEPGALARLVRQAFDGAP